MILDAYKSYFALTSECGFAEMAKAVKNISDLIRISDELE